MQSLDARRWPKQARAPGARPRLRPTYQVHDLLLRQRLRAQLGGQHVVDQLGDAAQHGGAIGRGQGDRILLCHHGQAGCGVGLLQHVGHHCLGTCRVVGTPIARGVGGGGGRGVMCVWGGVGRGGRTRGRAAACARAPGGAAGRQHASCAARTVVGHGHGGVIVLVQLLCVAELALHHLHQASARARAGGSTPMHERASFPPAPAAAAAPRVQGGPLRR